MIIACNPILLEFVAGAVLALVLRRFGRHRRLGIGLVIASVILTIYFMVSPPVAATGEQMVLVDSLVLARVASWGLAAGLLVAGVVFWSPLIRNWPGKLIVVIGNSSYSAYLASALVLEFTMRFMIKAFGSGPLSLPRVALYQTVSSIAVLLFGWVFYQCVEWRLLRSMLALFFEPKARAR